MKQLLYSILTAVIFVGCTADLDNQRIATGNETDYNKIVNNSQGAVQGCILVCFNPNAESRLASCATRTGATRTGVEGVDIILDGVGGYAVKPIFTITKKNQNRVHAAGLHLWYKLYFDSESDMDAIANALAKVGEISCVEFEHKIQRIGAPKGLSSMVQPSQSTSRAVSNDKVPFNDAYASYQWALCNQDNNDHILWLNRNWKLSAPIAEADINIVPAWKLCKGDPSIIVAVLDEGVMYSHEDLKDNMWINSAEQNGVKGVDDDGNGKIDDIYGYNFVFNNGNITWNKPDDSGHGTHVAGIISAINNNGKGVCGIAGGSGNNDGVKIMTVQTFSGDGGSNYSDTADAIKYAADCGAHILQCSWGYGSANVTTGVPANDTAFRNNMSVLAKAIDYFIAPRKDSTDSPIDGGVAIFASGNDGEGLICYPAGYEPCVAVSAFGPSLKLAYYSNYGPGTDIMAPGGEALYGNGAILSTLPDDFDDPTLTHYGLMQGTSQACPHVSGIAALGLSYAKQLGKRFTANEFRSMLLSAANDIEPFLVGEVTDIPWDYGTTKKMDYRLFKGRKLGTGYIDAYKLLLQIDGTPYTVVTSGEEQVIDLSTYFGDGIYNAYLSKIEISDADRAEIGVETCEYSKGLLTFKCSKSGAATISVTLRVGGGAANYPSKEPIATAVTKKFAIISRSNRSENNGWL